MWIPWDWKGISRNPNIDFSLVERFPERNWCWMSLSSHPKITLETINSNPNFPWDKLEIVKNPVEPEPELLEDLEEIKTVDIGIKKKKWL